MFPGILFSCTFHYLLRFRQELITSIFNSISLSFQQSERIQKKKGRKKNPTYIPQGTTSSPGIYTAVFPTIHHALGHSAQVPGHPQLQIGSGALSSVKTLSFIVVQLLNSENSWFSELTSILTWLHIRTQSGLLRALSIRQ